MTPIKRNLLYIFRGTLLRLRISWNHGTNLTLSLGYNVDRDKWDGSRCRRNTTHGPDKIPALTINRVIDALERDIDAAFLQFETADTIPTKDQLKEALKPGQEKESDFGDIFERYISEVGTVRFWSRRTEARMRVVKNLMLKFRPDIAFSSINEKTLDEFLVWQTSNLLVDRDDKNSYSNDTILKTFRSLHAFFKWALEKGYHSNRDILDYKPALKRIDRTIVFLTWPELMKVYHYDFSDNPRLEKVRDAFCFSCFTSLRYSDLANLKKANVGQDAITLTTMKTKDRLTIELNDFSRAILAKYADDGSEMALPLISDVKMNVYLKEMAEICGIDTPVVTYRMEGGRRIEKTVPKHQLISTHCGRRTFISNALALGIPVKVVMEWSGHSSYEAMKPYMAIADEVRRAQMSLFNNVGSAPENGTENGTKK